MVYRAVLLDQLPAGHRNRIAQTAFSAAADAHPLFSQNSHRYYECYFGGQHESLDAVVLRADEPVLFMPMSGTADCISYFGEPARIFGMPGLAGAEESAYTALWSFLSGDLGKRYARLKVIEDDRLTCNIVSRERHEIAHVDLRLPEASIRSGLRKSYKSLVNWGLRSMEFRVINRANPDAAAFRDFRDFHRLVAERATRSDESWELQLEMIRAGEAFAVLGLLDGRLVAATLVIHGSASAYYGVGVYDRELMADRKPIGHASVFRAILEARALGLGSFILGDTSHRGEAKADNIAKFKRGFASGISAESHAQVQLS